MRIESKFLTANVRITNVSVKDGRLAIEGLVKNALPVKVKVDLDDLKDVLGAIATDARGRLGNFLRNPFSR